MYVTMRIRSVVRCAADLLVPGFIGASWLALAFASLVRLGELGPALTELTKRIDPVAETTGAGVSQRDDASRSRSCQ